MLRVVLDTNIFVSSLLSKSGAPARVLDAWRQRKYLLLISSGILSEIRSVLNEPHLRKKYNLQVEDLNDLMVLLENQALLVPAQIDIQPGIPEDPKDEIFLACAVSGDADLIVSGDHHLLELGEFHHIPILTTQQFLEKLEGI